MEGKKKLVIDTQDLFLLNENVFWVNSMKICSLRFLSNLQFDDCLIRNTSPEHLTAKSFEWIWQKLKINAFLEIVIENDRNMSFEPNLFKR